MFIDNIKQFIANNPQIVMVTERGLETADRKVVFIAKDLDKRYPELKILFGQDIKSKPKIIETTKPEVIEVIKPQTSKKKSTKKK